MSETYLITGGAGNLACQLTFELVSRGGRVVLFDIADGPAGPVAPGCEYVRGDMTRPDDVSAVIARHKPGTIVHLASILGAACEKNRELAWRVNMDGAFHLFETALRGDVARFFFSSTVASYGGHVPDPLPEDFPQWPGGLYGVTKVACERLGVYYQHRHGLDFRCLRLPIVISKFGSANAASGYASLAFVQAAREGKYAFPVKPSTRASAIYVHDVVRAMMDLIHAPESQLTRRVYNVSAICPTAGEIRDAIVARLPSAQLTFTPDPLIVDLIESWPVHAEDASARKDWGWNPQYDLNRLADNFLSELRGHKTIVLTKNPPA